ncbi:MAG TPA: TonB-dependent receptor [Bryobacteraceae bacterium]|nr:TonB-dependent receptor [Bryobacteraceae bacterium]
MLRRTLVLCCLISAVIWSQEFRATITGRVVDSQGAVIPGVNITATLVTTGAKSETTTGADGLFTIPFLTPGTYRMEARRDGFKRYVRDGLAVSTGERVGLDIQLDLGQLSESVTVTAETPLLETATATTGQVIRSSQVENMPMNGRTPLVLAQLAMGVVPNSDPRFNRPFDNAGPSGFSMGGAPAQQNELLVDGAPDTTRNLRVAFNPPVDAVEEVRVHAFEVDAAYGHTGGGTANVVLKSGTNTLHGSAYEFNQVSALSATPFFTNKAGLVKPVTRFNQWGITAGGPLWIPKVFNGRNKVFWFFGWEGINDSFPEPITTTVPTQAERNGDLSALLKVGSNYQIYDPFSGVKQGSRIVRTPINNNVITKDKISSIATAYFQFYPLPNQPGDPDGHNNYLSNSVRRDTFNGEIGRLDFNISDHNKLFWNFRHNDRIENRGNRFFNIATGNFLGRVNQGTMLDDVHTFNATTVMNVRLNWTRFIESNSKPSDGFNATKLGLPAYVTAASPKLVLPIVDIGGGFNQLGDNGGDVTPFDIFQIFGDVVKIAGKHSLKIGADIRELRESSASYGNSQGSYQFRTDWTRGPFDNSTSAPLGQDFAAFLLGLPTGGSFDLNATRTNQAKYYALFVQDDWRIKNNLTLNLGIRYEQDLSTTERFNRSVNGFDITTPNPIAAAAQAAYAANYAKIGNADLLPPSQFKVLGGPLYASASNPDIYHTNSHIISPRIGFAWTPAALGTKTVIRGGFGVFVFPIGSVGVNQAGFSQSSSVVASLDSFLTPNATLANPFPAGIQTPTGSSLGLATFLGKDVTFFNSNVLNPYSMRWELSVQRELPWSTVLEVAYIGNHAVHLGMGSTARNTGDFQFNYVPGQYLSSSPTRDQATINRLTALVTNPFAGLIPGTSLNGATVQVQTLLQPFPEFGRINEQQNSGGSSYFDSLNVRLEKRYSKGLNFLANYTYSKLIEKFRLLNDFSTAPEKVISGDDRPQRFVVSTSYELPFGKNKPFSFGSPVANRLLGGWVVNGIYTWQVGAPLTWSTNNLIYLGGDLNLNPRGVNGTAFDTTRFNTNSAQQLGSNVRTFPTRFSNLRQDGANNFDLSVVKNTYITERVNLQLRLESFNAMNHPEFDAPNLTPTNSSFGKITNQPNLARAIQIGGRLVW